MYYVDLDLVDKAKEVLESTLKSSSMYLEEENKYVKIINLFIYKIYLVAKRLAFVISIKFKIL